MPSSERLVVMTILPLLCSFSVASVAAEVDTG